MMPVTRIIDVEVNGEPVGDILVADSGAMIGRQEFPNEEHQLPFFFRTGYAIDRPGDKTWLAAFCDYPIDAFSDVETSARQQARVRDCVTNAVQTIHQLAQAGLFDGRNRSQLQN